MAKKDKSIRALPEFIIEKIQKTPLLTQPIDQFRYTIVPSSLGRAFGSKSKEKSLNGSAMSELYTADIHYPYQIATLEKLKVQHNHQSKKALMLPSGVKLRVELLSPLVAAMKEQHVNLEEWVAFQDILLKADLHQLSSEMHALRILFPDHKDDVLNGFLEACNERGNTVFENVEADLNEFVETGGLPIKVQKKTGKPAPRSAAHNWANHPQDPSDGM